VDRASAELRRLEFEYTRAPTRGPRGVPGGTVEFLRLPDGRWLTSAWQIRMPVEGVRGGNTIVEQPRQVIAIREVGGTARPGITPRTVPTSAGGPLALNVDGASPPQAAAAADEPAPDPIRPSALRVSDRRRLIARDEVERSHANNAYELVQASRAQWLQTRGNDGARGGGLDLRHGATTATLSDVSVIAVFVDGRRIGSLEVLSSIARTEVDRVEYYDGVEAQQRWGSGHPQGAIHVITRRR
jgi:hypothetical protein